jgi:FlaA1/EpsC-like NDP-sugar epimerase
MYVIFFIDILILCLAWYGAHLIRFEFNIPQHRVDLLTKSMPLVLGVKEVLFVLFGLYRGMWRYTSLSDLQNIIKATLLSCCVLIAIVLLFNRFEGFSRSVFIIDCGLTLLMISGCRLGIRLFFTQFGSPKSFMEIIKSSTKIFKQEQDDFKRLIIIGAGDCGEKIFREIKDNPRLQYTVVGFLDDHPVKKNKRIHGIPVIGKISDLETFANNFEIDELLIAIPSANASQMRRIVGTCQASGVRSRTIPGYGELLNRRISFSAVRDVAYRDLLGREVVELEDELIGECLRGQTIMVTGAGGSIGSELCRQICRFEPSRLILFERAESPLHEIQLELQKNFSRVHIKALLADIQYRDQIDAAFKKYSPSIVFHAAAYKHVPMMESHPWKAVKNNIAGTANLVEAALEFKIDRFVMVSTDKAVRPTNVMGASKRVAEMLVQNSACDSDTKFITVRFGNVIGSVGSVIPLFKKQIAQGGPVTVTHPDMRRFFMMIPEASQLILQAGAMGHGGEIFILDMGEPVKIDDMARDLIRFSGLEPDRDIQIEYIGLRPGEKLFEELIAEGENTVATDHDKIMVLNGIDCNIGVLNGSIERLKQAAEKQDSNAVIDLLQKILPEYKPAQN